MSRGTYIVNSILYAPYYILLYIVSYEKISGKRERDKISVGGTAARQQNIIDVRVRLRKRIGFPFQKLPITEFIVIYVPI